MAPSWPCFLLPLGLLLLTSHTHLTHACGYASCPSTSNTSQLHLHIIAHSHDDVGWMRTADGYADGDANPLLSAVVDALLRSTERRFVQVEMYYFTRWWARQTPGTQASVHRLIASGQFTFAGGGWCMADEATTHYSALIDQMTLGHAFLRRTFDACAAPKLSWQIDPFGASREAANLFAQMGFDGHVTNRGNDQLVGDFTWKTSDSGRQFFTTRTHHHYHAPDGFNFEDADEITEANKHQKAATLVELGRKWNADYGASGHVLMTFGHDFSFKHAERWFSNLDRLIDAVRSDYPSVHLHYSSPHCYIQAIRDLKPNLPVKSGDFFPYWTGYFTSRPGVKALVRSSNGFLQAAKHLAVLGDLGQGGRALLSEAENELAILQHHDAITGTSPPGVMADYRARLLSGLKASTEVLRKALARLTSKPGSVSAVQKPTIYTTVNISDAHLTPSHPAFASIIYNPLAQSRSSWIRLPIDGPAYRLLDSKGNPLNSSVVPIPDKVKSLLGHHRAITHELVFSAVSLPPLGFSTYFTLKDPTHRSLAERKPPTDAHSLHYILPGSDFSLYIRQTDGSIDGLLRNGTKHRLRQSYGYYVSNQGSGSDSYRFCPSTGPKPLGLTPKLVHAAQYDGFSEITVQVEADWIVQTIRVYEDKSTVEIDWTVGPVEDRHGSKEVFVKFTTDLQSNGTFTTDSNGRQDMLRTFNPKPHFCGASADNVATNYYPVTSRASIADSQTGHSLTLLPDRSVGATSLTNGALELMLHRRLLYHIGNGIDLNDLDTDGKGVVTRGKLLLLFTDQSSKADASRQATIHHFHQPIVALTPTESVDKYIQTHTLSYSGLKAPLPPNIHLLSLENSSPTNNELLLRLENFYQPSDNSKLATSATLNLNFLSNLDVTSAQRTNLLGGEASNLTNHTIHLGPSEIGTFLLEVNRSSTSSPHCSLKWGHISGNHSLPEHAIKAGHEHDTGEALFICRHHHGGDLLPGKYRHGINCRSSNGGEELVFNDEKAIEILTGTRYQWVPRHGGDVPPQGAFVAGHAHGGHLYIGRCARNGLVVGKIDTYFYYAYGRKEHKDCVDHEILTC